jgi:hypothetical protein
MSWWFGASPALRCTALHCTVLHCTALHCTALHYTALRCTALHCNTAPRAGGVVNGRRRSRMWVQCSAVQCSAVQCSAVQCSAVQCSAVPLRGASDWCLHWLRRAAGPWAGTRQEQAGGFPGTPQASRQEHLRPLLTGQCTAQCTA